MALATAGAVTVVLTATTPALAASPAQSCFQSAVNGERAASGLAALSSDPTLVSIATSWSETLASQGILEHNPNLNAEVPQAWRTLGENVGRGPSCSDIAAAFFASPEHRANILDPNYSAVGVGVVVAGDGETYVTEDFAGEHTGGSTLVVAPVAAPAKVVPTVPKVAATPTPAPVVPASQPAGDSQLMIEAVSNVSASGAVVPVSAPAPAPQAVASPSAHHGHAPRHHPAGLLSRLGHAVGHFFSHLA